MLKLIICLILLGFLFPCLSGTLLAENKRSRFLDNYIFYHAPEDSQLVQNTIKKITPKIVNIENFFEGRSLSEIHIFLTKSEEEFQSYSKNGFPEWSQAIAFVEKRTIIIRAKNGDEINRLPQVLLHELVHIYIGIISPEKYIPTWLHEGVAQLLSYESLTINEQIYISNALYSGKLTNLSNLDSMFNFTTQQALLGYALSRSAVDYFLKKYDMQALFRTLKKVNSTRSINRAFVEVTGRDFVDFETGWFAYVDKEYKWLFILNIDYLIWFILIVLFLIAVMRIKYKNRKIIRNWEEEI